MTDKLTPVSWNRFVSRMNKLGFSGPISGGKHPKRQLNYNNSQQT